MMRRTHGACVTSVLCARVLVCKAQSSERGRGSGEAKPGARHASLCALNFCPRAFFLPKGQKREACVPACASERGSFFRVVALVQRERLLGAAAATATPVATLHVNGHGAEAFYGRSKRKEEDQNDGSAGSSRRA